MSAVLAMVAAALLVAAAAEAWGEVGERSRSALRARLRSARLPVPLFGVLDATRERALRLRLRRAGLEGRLSPRAVLGLRGLSGLAALPVTVQVAPLAPGRTAILIAAGVPLGAALAPDLVIERLAARRRARLAAALPDALELIAVGAASGRSQLALIADAAQLSSGPLREELAGLAATLELGGSRADVLPAFGREVGGELGALAARLERSRRLGAPLARGLHEQAIGLRADQARRIGEQAARAAPKIQLVVALLLVPSVLLLVAAAIVANADAVFVGLQR